MNASKRIFTALSALVLITLLSACAAKQKASPAVPRRQVVDISAKSKQVPRQEPSSDTQGKGALTLRPVYFDYDSAVLRADALESLARVSRELKRERKVALVVEGHCDERGTEEYNLVLGERRASAIRGHLVRLGVEPSRINIISYGKRRPAAAGRNEQAWARNRRGELQPRGSTGR